MLVILACGDCDLVGEGDWYAIDGGKFGGASRLYSLFYTFHRRVVASGLG
jgi:hypothetical protein